MYSIEFNGLGRKIISEEWHPNSLPGLYRLYYVYSGSAYFHDKRLEAGKMYIFPPVRRDEWERADCFDHLFFDFFISPPLMVGEYFELALEPYPEIKAICDAASAVFVSNKIIDNAIEKRETAKGLLTSILLLVERIAPLNTVRDERIVAALDYIREHLHEEIDLDVLASVSCYSKHWFCKLFAKEIGMTPIKYIRQTRLQFATMLLSRGISVKEVAARVGFTSVKTFSENYKSMYGILPSLVYQFK